MRGEFLRLDPANGAFVVRVESGMEQTFRFDKHTVVRGLEQSLGREGAATTVRSLAGYVGSDLSIRWKHDSRGKLATSIDVKRMDSSSVK